MNRKLFPETKVLDDKAGIIEYIASDQTIDHAREVVRADGWRFDYFQRNAPFVDSHRAGGIENLVGKVLSARVDGSRLVETVQWAVDVPENRMAKLGYEMTKAGYLRAVSVGFKPERLVTTLAQEDWPNDWSGATMAWSKTKSGRGVWNQQLANLGLPDDGRVNTIYLQQQQLELSACIIPCNPNATVNKSFCQAYKAGLMTDSDLELISSKMTEHATADATDDPAGVAKARQRARTAFLLGITQQIKAL